MRAGLLFIASVVVAGLAACGDDASTPATQHDSATPAPVVPNVGSPTTTAASSVSVTAPVDAGTTEPIDAAPPPPPPPPPDVTLTTETMTFNGQTRSYILGTPRAYDAAQAYPLVMIFHGNPGNKEQIRAGMPFENVSANHAILVYPDALQGAWDLYTPTSTNVDMSFINALPAAVGKTLNVDASRVYGVGMSGGAFMMAQMGCSFGASTFRAVALNSGGGPQEDQSGYAQRPDQCYVCPGGPIPILIIHGDADTMVVPESGEFTQKCYSETNGCSAQPNQPVSPSPCMTAPGCQKPVEWCLIPGMNHAIWDQTMQTAWDFFNAN